MKLINKSLIEPLALPALRGRMGDWYYYVTLLTFNEIAKRVFLPKEIDKYQKGFDQKKLGNWIQRELAKKRITEIVDYLKNQKQRFFNSLILGLYEGNPSWQDLKITVDSTYETVSQDDLDYLSRTFGILNLDGNESIFAIDGQHRAISIREVLKTNPSMGEEEISVIFVAHQTDNSGKIRTRRLFSTLNKYAKPVSKSEIIALSEDNNCAIITRNIVEAYAPLKNRILVNKNRAISPANKNAFTNILTLYDMIEILLTDKKVATFKVRGEPYKSFTINRAKDEIIKEKEILVKRFLSEMNSNVASLKKFYESGKVNRNAKETSLLFRPIGQIVYTNVIKVAKEHNAKSKAINYFKKDTFNLKNKIWRKIFWDSKTNSISSEKSRQRYAILLIIEHLGISVRRTRKDEDIFNSFNINPKEI